MLQLQIGDAPNEDRVAVCAGSIRTLEMPESVTHRSDLRTFANIASRAPRTCFVSKRGLKRSTPCDQEPRRETPDKDRAQHPESKTPLL